MLGAQWLRNWVRRMLSSVYSSYWSWESNLSSHPKPTTLGGLSILLDFSVPPSSAKWML